MNKKDLKFTIGLTILMGVLWAIGELVMGLWVVSVWHSMIEDKSDLVDPKRAKYERKTTKRKKK